MSRDVGCPEGDVCPGGVWDWCPPGGGSSRGCVCIQGGVCRGCTPPHCKLRLRAVTMHGRYLDQNKSMWPDLAHVNKQKRLFDTRYL